MNKDNSPFFTIQEVSEFLGISTSTINRLVKKGDFPPKVKISPRRIVFMKKEKIRQVKETIENYLLHQVQYSRRSLTRVSLANVAKR